jgi:transposase
MVITLFGQPVRRPNTTGSRTAPAPFLSDAQWFLIADLFSLRPVGKAGGRPRVPSRPCLEGILWILQTGARWQDLPERYPSPCTCWRRLKEWTESGVWIIAWQRLLGKLDRFQQIHWDEAIADGSFAAAQKGGPESATPRKARAPRSCS